MNLVTYGLEGRWRGAIASVMAAGFLVSACGEDNTLPEPPPSADEPNVSDTTRVELERVYPNLTFNQPLALIAGPGPNDALYVLERPGRIWRLSDAAPTEETARTEVADARDLVDSGPGEGGLLGLAFAPDFDDTRELYLSFTETVDGQLKSAVARYIMRDDWTVDLDTRVTILSVDQPAGNHNGGQVAFGPDALLYISLGDGGGAGDPFNQGQDPSTILGTLLRIDVRASTRGDAPYIIPEANPFADGSDGAPEVYAYGLRNVWRFSFDEDGTLWAADVGQNAVEEINHIAPGANYGWPIKEGTRCFASDPCDDPGLTDPVFEYGHAAGDRSITGGYTYRGEAVPSLRGRYVFGDFVSGRIWALSSQAPYTATQVASNTETDLAISAFGQTHDGELRVVDFASGSLYRFTETLIR